MTVGTVGGWALHTMLATPADVLGPSGYTLVATEHGTVGQSLRLNTSASWSAESVAISHSVGTVTSVELGEGERAEPGTQLYTVNLRPVVVAEGDVPAFRDLRWGDHGADVAQLQQLLRAMGYVAGDDGTFGATLNRAVREWQRDLGVSVDGVVRHGDVVYVQTLPAALVLDVKLAVGTTVTGGEPAVHVLSESPSFSITLTENQARMVQPGMLVDIVREGVPWQARIDELITTPDLGGVLALLSPVGGGSICGDECFAVPVGEETLLPSLIHMVPEVSGVVVPVAALVTTATGTPALVLASGEVRSVSVVESASGTAVVEGIEVGERVRVPGDIPAGESKLDQSS